ncbi:MAG TPA: hypothetical protein VIA06_11645 [Candidatus Dormibacteraeota bacterium]|jgi:photosystem II stability/assembly factor-like uncharacterized protein|nr:hypothetical protein [Candidatus Dormibacteraeota bacterium]
MFETYAGTRGGVVRIDGTVAPLGLTDRRVGAVHVLRGASGDTVIVAGGDGLFRSVDGGRNWSPVEGMSAPVVRSLVADPFNEGGILCGTEPARIFRSLDEGATWTELGGVAALPDHDGWFLPYSPYAGALRNLYVPPGGSGRMLASVEVGGLLDSADRGETWSIAPIGPNDDIHQITGHPAQAERLWAALGYAALPSRHRDSGSPRLGGVGRSRDGGRTWEILHTDYTRSAIVPPARPDLVLAGPAPEVGAQGRIEVSDDDGDSWQPSGEGVESPMPDMVELFVPAPDSSIYAVRSRGGLLRSEPGPWRWRSALPDGRAEDVLAVSFLEG